ncbi:MAG: SMC family ATPase [Nitrosopumilaceae archaeon]|nr:SMC family ATPase [Nitrosopumilaceae archaeon]
MITSVEMGDFLSHQDTKLEFDNGVTVFVGHNGAGKSSIIDAITFALFGTHTRKSNKGLIKRGSNQGFAKITFTVKGKNYQAERKIDSKGNLYAQFSEIIDGETRQIAAGERKQFGESMTKEIEKRIGLNFEKLKVASIVQQGELNSIIKAKPKEFKELLNAIIGIDRLDVASELMKSVKKDFRDKIRQDNGYDDTHIDILARELENYKKELEEARPLKLKLVEKRESISKILVDLKEKLDQDTPKIEKLSQLEIRKQELTKYAREAIHNIQREIVEKEKKIRDCQDCFEYASIKQDIEIKATKVDEAILDVQKKIQECTNQKISLKEKHILAQKLELKDNRCPVCDSHVEKLNPLFQIKHLEEEEKKITKEIISLEKELEIYNKKKQEFAEKIQKARDAQAILNAHSINNKDELEKIKEEIKTRKENIQNIPITASSGSLVQMAQIDSHAKNIFDTISKLEEDIKNFDEGEFSKLKEAVNEKQAEISEIDQKIGAINEKISKAEKQISDIEKVTKNLDSVKKYVSELDSIQENVFSRDGPVATSLRSWALNTISAKSSEYLALLNTKIQRIQLAEKKRDISISCYSKNEVLDLESLSGGEQVSIALSLRLGMASLLGASNLNLIILDEPTTHLDSERRKALVGVLSQLTNITNSGMPMQFIIITHDSEIFEDSTVERIYKFESTQNGSKVSVL